MSKSNAARTPALKKPLDSTTANFTAKSPFQRWGQFKLEPIMSGAAPWPPRGSCAHTTESFNFELIGRIFAKEKMDDLLTQALAASSIKDTPWARELFEVIAFLWSIEREISLDAAKAKLKTKATYIMFLDLKESKQKYDATLSNPFLRRENFFIKLEWLDLTSEQVGNWQRAFSFYTGENNKRAGLLTSHQPRDPRGFVTLPINTIDKICDTHEADQANKRRLARKADEYSELVNIDGKWNNLCEDPSDTDFTPDTKTLSSQRMQKEKRPSEVRPSLTTYSTTNRQPEPSTALAIRTSSASIDNPSKSAKSFSNTAESLANSAKSADDGLSMIERQFRKRQRAHTIEKDDTLALAIETIATYETWMVAISARFENDDIDSVRKIVETSKTLHRVERMAEVAGLDALKIVERVFDQDLATSPLKLNKRWDDLA